MTVFGIDLGTSYSCIVRNDGTGGVAPVELLNADGKKFIPSVVTYDKKTGQPIGQNIDDHHDHHHDHHGHSHGDSNVSRSIIRLVVTLIVLVVAVFAPLASTLSLMLFIIAYLVAGDDVIWTAIRNLFNGMNDRCVVSFTKTISTFLQTAIG